MKLLYVIFLVGAWLFGSEALSAQSSTSHGELTLQRTTPSTTSSDIYFKANGDDPTWTLIISPHGIEFRTTATGYQNFSAPHADPIKAMDSNIKMYKLKTEEGSMEVELASMTCQNEGSRERFTYSVSIALQQGQDTSIYYFSGCGKFITEPDLEFKWVLQQLGADTVTAEQFNDTLPYLLIYSRANSFEGYSGCNTINGRLFSERSTLRFTNLYLSKRTCATIAKEEEFIKALQFSTEFKLNGDSLILSNYRGVTLVFEKEKNGM